MCILPVWVSIYVIRISFPNRHLDGNHKLIQPYRIVIHGGIDGFSRLIVFLKASTNNRASTVMECFRGAVDKYSLPSHVRTDLGLENIDVARFMLERRGLNRGSIITGTSVHNQCIERMWREVNCIVCSRFVNIFSFLESLVLDTTNEVHLFVLHLVYIPLINQALKELSEAWNCHALSTEGNLSPRQLWVQGMITSQNTIYSAVASVHDNEEINWDEYGIDEDGPVAELQSTYSVTVPESPINLTDEQAQHLQQIVHVLKEAGDQDGLIAFRIVLEYLQVTQ